MNNIIELNFLSSWTHTQSWNKGNEGVYRCEEVNPSDYKVTCPRTHISLFLSFGALVTRTERGDLCWSAVMDYLIENELFGFKLTFLNSRKNTWEQKLSKVGTHVIWDKTTTVLVFIATWLLCFLMLDASDQSQLAYRNHWTTRKWNNDNEIR